MGSDVRKSFTAKWVQTRPLKQGRYHPLSLIRKGRCQRKVPDTRATCAHNHTPADICRLDVPLIQTPPSRPHRPRIHPEWLGVWMVLLSFPSTGVWGATWRNALSTPDSQVIWRTTERLAPTQMAKHPGEPARLMEAQPASPVGSGLYRLTFDLGAPAALDSQQRPGLCALIACAAHEVLLNQQRIRST